MPCTTILVGKNASYDGSTMMARNEDCGAGHYTPKRFIVVRPEQQPRDYQSVISKVKIKLPDDPVRYTKMPNALPDEGDWGAAGVNMYNVAMTATETITSNPRVLGADPLVKEGIGEEDMVTIVLPYIRSAREGVLRLGKLLEEYGTYEMNGIGFQDVNELWWFESIGGHHWIAKRVEDDEYVIMPNQQGIDSFDLDDAYSEKKNHLCSEDLIDFLQKNHLMLDIPGSIAANRFDVRAALGSHSDMDHSYNTPRAWFMGRYLSGKQYNWDGPQADFKPVSDDIPWSLKPDRLITAEDIKYVLSSYYQGTPYNPYGKYGDKSMQGMYRPIGINRTNFMSLTQLRPDMPDEIMAIEWVAFGSNAFNQMIPFYIQVNGTPEYMANAGRTATTESFYWANRYIAALTDAHYPTCMAFVERYENKLLALGHNMIAGFDKEYIRNMPEDVSGYLERCNQKIADTAKEETYALLGQVLCEASNGMKNAYSRSDA